MKPLLITIMLMMFAGVNSARAQKQVDRVKFFKDSAVVNATLSLNVKRVMARKEKVGLIFPAMFSCCIDDSIEVNNPISIEVRGHFRRAFCYLPPIKLIFKDNPATALYHLKSIKLVSTCNPTIIDDQNLLKEYTIYKIYNLITDKSFRVRLLNINYRDSSGRSKTITAHAFMIEDIKQVIKRNKCEDWTERKMANASIDRRQMTIAAIFEYMIGNTDWSIPFRHNIKLIHSTQDSLSRPFVVPYDFDFSGLVNTSYSTPDGTLGIESVKDRLYRGFPASIDELNEALSVFNLQKASIYGCINNFNLLTPVSKREMISYLDLFYKTISDPLEAQDTFITNAKL